MYEFQRKRSTSSFISENRLNFSYTLLKVHLNLNVHVVNHKSQEDQTMHFFVFTILFFLLIYSLIDKYLVLTSIISSDELGWNFRHAHLTLLHRAFVTELQKPFKRNYSVQKKFIHSFLYARPHIVTNHLCMSEVNPPLSLEQVEHQNARQKTYWHQTKVTLYRRPSTILDISQNIKYKL